MGFFHEFSGWLMFLVSLGCLYLVHLVMRLVFEGKAGKRGCGLRGTGWWIW